MSEAKTNGAPERVFFEIPGKGKYELFNVKLNIPKLGIVTATELVQMPKVLEHLVNINSGAILKVADSPLKASEAPKEKKEPKKGGN
jgi:hypothetical protein